MYWYLTVAIFTGIIYCIFCFGKKYYQSLHNTETIKRKTAVEDALKHFYNFKCKNQKVSMQSLCGSMGIKGGKAAELIAILESQNYVISGKHGLSLTPDGQTCALKIIRAHRLWECYLADKTGFAQTEWHQWAEELEHDMDDVEIHELAASVGNPLYDPHGDPIPTPTGEMPPLEELPLTNLDPGDYAEIVHLEDEPKEVFAQIAACGLSPGQLIQLREKSPQQIEFILHGEAVSLLPVIAANIAVQWLQFAPPLTGKYETLADLKLGEYGKVLSISNLCRGMQRRRIMDLGAIPGTIISVELNSAGGDPVGYGIRGAVIALRKEQSEMIQIERLKEYV